MTKSKNFRNWIEEDYSEEEKDTSRYKRKDEKRYDRKKAKIQSARRNKRKNKFSHLE